MNAGDLRTRVRLQVRANVADGRGGNTVTWSDLGTYWVNITLVGGAEPFAGEKQNPTVSHTVTMRYRRAVVPAQRILVAPERVLDIKSVLDMDEKHEWLTLGCEEYHA